MILVADSGGTKTDWCYIDALNNRKYFTTESYHPSNWSEAFWVRFNDFWRKHPVYHNCNLEFYGAGMLNENRADKLSASFFKAGFKQVAVKSDLYAAGKALKIEGRATVAILGTGSVLFQFVDGEIQNIIGGKGHELGDEGSGYYFGKLVYQAFQNNSLTDNQMKLFQKNVTIDLLEKSFNTKSGKFEVANIAYLLRKETTEFYDFHKQNCLAFYKAHQVGVQDGKLNIIGSYAFHFQDIIRSVFSSFSVEIEQVIERPIRTLID